MANPQKENGFVPIATEIYEALCRTRINGEARQVLDTIIRKTYGFRKKEDAIALSQFSLATHLKKPTIIKALAKLRLMNLITQKGNAVANIYGLNKNFDTWNPLPKKVTEPKKITTITQKGNNRNPKRYPQKIITIDTITKDNVSYQLTELLHAKVGDNFPFIKPPAKAKLLQDAKEMDKLIRLDKREPDVIKAVIVWATQDEFWKQNIRSVGKLRKQFDSLLVKIQSKYNNPKVIKI